MATSCTNCGSDKLIWECTVKNFGEVQDGRICMRETGAIFFFGCEECSETIKVVDGDKIAEFLNKKI